MASPLVAQAPGGGERPPAAVTVVTLSATDATLTATLPGRVVASGIAEVRPQVDGIIVERTFHEGDEVALGDPLYTIDAATYQASVAAARAQVTQAEAQLRTATNDSKRLEELISRKIASEQNYETAIGQRDSAAAALQLAQAQLQTAEINLDRTTVRAPLSGYIGRTLTTQGTLVTSGQAQPLAVIRKIDPVYVDVTQSAAEILDWRRGLMTNRLANAAPEVVLTLADGTLYDHHGLLTVAETNVNEQTGVVTLRLEFPNPDKLLLPGMYVQVDLPQGVAENVVLAPQEGVSYDRRGLPVAMVVNAENVVEQRDLEVLQARGSDWIVRSGLSAGDRLIVEGLQKTAPGATVAPEERGSAQPAAAPADAG
ncbi:efflux transporter periplasmic adaptor subunit [Pseudoruegeria sp. SK021]|nr:efflux RND transporter periplasmic adaptor subunit [Pseudoruegeria sp. SK021]OSP56833.1 efflux transporter periplasmic adaptor subunit [Pseudoruegeria sp. SK021]